MLSSSRTRLLARPAPFDHGARFFQPCLSHLGRAGCDRSEGVPLETHVFVSLLTGLPVYVVTRAGNWRVKGDRISFLGEREPDGAS